MTTILSQEEPMNEQNEHAMILVVELFTIPAEQNHQ